MWWKVGNTITPVPLPHLLSLPVLTEIGSDVGSDVLPLQKCMNGREESGQYLISHFCHALRDDTEAALVYFPIWSHVNGLYRRGNCASPPLVSHFLFCRPSSKALEVILWTYDGTMLTRFPGGSQG